MFIFLFKIMPIEVFILFISIQLLIYNNCTECPNIIVKFNGQTLTIKSNVIRTDTSMVF